MKDFKLLAREFDLKVKSEGFTYSISEIGNVVTIHKKFNPGDSSTYVKCDMIAPFLISLIPAGIGSIWGTEGSGIGGHFSITNGNFFLNKSNVRKRFINELKKLNHDNY